MAETLGLKTLTYNRSRFRFGCVQPVQTKCSRLVSTAGPSMRKLIPFWTATGTESQTLQWSSDSKVSDLTAEGCSQLQTVTHWEMIPQAAMIRIGLSSGGQMATEETKIYIMWCVIDFFWMGQSYCEILSLPFNNVPRVQKSGVVGTTFPQKLQRNHKQS